MTIFLAVTGAVVWTAVIAMAFIVVFDPGDGWSQSCMFGSWWRREHGVPDEGPECEWNISPRWYWPEWTKGPRFRAHWAIRHHGAPKRLPRPFVNVHNDTEETYPR